MPAFCYSVVTDVYQNKAIRQSEAQWEAHVTKLMEDEVYEASALLLLSGSTGGAGARDGATAAAPAPGTNVGMQATSGAPADRPESGSAAMPQLRSVGHRQTVLFGAVDALSDELVKAARDPTRGLRSRPVGAARDSGGSSDEAGSDASEDAGREDGASPENSDSDTASSGRGSSGSDDGGGGLTRRGGAEVPATARAPSQSVSQHQRRRLRVLQAERARMRALRAEQEAQERRIADQRALLQAQDEALHERSAKEAAAKERQRLEHAAHDAEQRLRALEEQRREEARAREAAFEAQLAQQREVLRLQEEQLRELREQLESSVLLRSAPVLPALDAAPVAAADGGQAAAVSDALVPSVAPPGQSPSSGAVSLELAAAGTASPPMIPVRGTAAPCGSDETSNPPLPTARKLALHSPHRSSEDSSLVMARAEVPSDARILSGTPGALDAGGAVFLEPAPASPRCANSLPEVHTEAHVDRDVDARARDGIGSAPIVATPALFSTLPSLRASPSASIAPPTRRLQPRVLRDPSQRDPNLIGALPAAPATTQGTSAADPTTDAASSPVRLRGVTSIPTYMTAPPVSDAAVLYAGEVHEDDVALPARPPPLGALQHTRGVLHPTLEEVREALPARPPSLASSFAAAPDTSLSRSGMRRLAKPLSVPDVPPPSRALHWSPMHQGAAPDVWPPAAAAGPNPVSTSLPAALIRGNIGPPATTEVPDARPPSINPASGRIYSTPAGAALAAALAALDGLRSGTGKSVSS